MIQDHKSLDKTLISPAFLHFFAIYPPFIKNWARRYYNEIGINFVSLRKQKEIVKDCLYFCSLSILYTLSSCFFVILKTETEQTFFLYELFRRFD